jgi:PAS domain S-box-containing protein
MAASDTPPVSARKARRAIQANGANKPALWAINALGGLILILVGAAPAGAVLLGLTTIHVAGLHLLEPRWFSAIERGEHQRPYRQMFALRTVWNWTNPCVIIAAVLSFPSPEVAFVALVCLQTGIAFDMTRAVTGRSRMLIYAAGPLCGIAALAVIQASRAMSLGDLSWLGVTFSFLLLAVTVLITWRHIEEVFNRIFQLRAEQDALVAKLTEAHTEVNQSKERLTAALESGEIGIWEIDLENRDAQPSPFLTRLFGKPLTYEAMRSGEALDMVIPEDRERVSDLLRRLHHGPPLAETIEHAIYLADGTVGYVQTVAKSFPNRQGRIGRIVLSTSNTTEKRRQELELGAMLKAADAALQRRRRLLSALQGGARESPADPPSTDNHADLAAMRRQLAQVLSEINVRDLALAKAVETVLEAQAKAQEASIAKSQFLANMSHELRTPLNAIIGYSEIVMEDLTSAKMQTQLGDLERIRAAGHHLLGLISEVLDLSKIEAGRLDIHPEPCDAAAIAREAVETVEVMAARQGSVCELIIEVADTTIVSDPGRLKQCLLNLLSNAAKFTEKGRITLTMRRALIGEAQGLSFEVKDTGIGISPENLAKLFQPFVQVDGSRTRRAGGAGIGLVITKHLAQLLGGDIAVTSEVDVGSVFTLTIRNLHIDDDEVWIAA